MIQINKLSETFSRVICNDASIIQEIIEKFSFEDPASQNHWKVKKGWGKTWKTCLFDKKNRTIWNGLLPNLIDWLDSSGYEYKIDGNYTGEKFSVNQAEDFIKTLNIPSKYEIRDYQLKYFVKCVRNYRGICLSPTSSGKSLIMYLIYRYFDRKTLIIVPSVTLVYQLFSDFKDYGYDADNNIHLVMAGTTKNESKKQLTISTWQSLVDENRDYYGDIQVIIGDEAHGFKASSLVKIMTLASNTPIRVALTGTLTGVPLYDFQIQGLFGPLFQYITTREMIDRGFSPDLEINGIVLSHNKSPWYEAFLPRVEYIDEVNYLLDSEARNKFICKLTLSLKGNTFIMFRKIDHGKKIYNILLNNSNGIPIHFVSGQTSAKEREILRGQIERLENSITVASTVFATGVNITSIDNIIFINPSKSRIRVLQSIGRGLRKNPRKKKLFVYDIADRLLQSGDTITLEHFRKRVKIYKEEQFNYSIHKVDLNNT